MLNNIYILRKIVVELQHFVGCKIVDCYTNNTGILHFELFDGEILNILNISLITDFEAIFISESKNKPKRNIYKQFNIILGEIIQKIEIVAQNRIIKLELINYNLYFHFFGKSQNNAVLTDKYDNIQDVLKNKRDLVHSKYLIVHPNLLKIHEFAGYYKLRTAISRSNFLFGKYLTNELLSRLNMNGDKTISELSPKDFEKLQNYAYQLIHEIESTDSYYYLQNENKAVVFSPIKLAEYSIIIEESKNLFYLIRKVFSHRITKYRFDVLFKSMKNVDEKFLKKYESKVKRFEEIPNLIKIIKQYQLYTDLLYTIQNLKQKGLDKLRMIDFDGNSVEIPLDAKLSIIQNIEKYYLKIKKIKRDINIIEKNHSSIIDEFNTHYQRYQKLISIDNYSDLKTFYKTNLTFYRKSMQNIPKEISEKFRKFEIGSNAILYVGKDSKNNDELTFGFGKPNDFWFHLRGGSGSHCILKFTGDGKPSKEIIEKSASIAAYYSSQRNGGFVPVIYTQRKYVRKPKGANPGSVVVAKEEVIMVTPKSYDDIK